MTLLSWAMAGVAAAIAIPALVILYFLKLRRRDVEVSSTLLWKKAIEDMQANAPFQRLRRNILLFLQLLALGAALFALGNPVVRRQVIEGKKHAILIDRSGSMGSSDAGDATRLDEAKRQATALVDSLREPGVFERGAEGDEAMVIAFSDHAEVLMGFTSDKRALRDAISSIRPSHGRSNIAEAMTLAQAHAPRRFLEGLGLQPTGIPISLHVWSDGRLVDVDRARSEPENELIYHEVGSRDARNVGVTVLQAQRSYDDPSVLRVFVGLQNADAGARQVDVELLVDGQPASLRTVTLPASTPAAIGEGAGPDQPSATTARATPGVGGTAFLLARPEGAVIEVALREPGTGDRPAGDVLDADDRAWLVVPPAKRVALACVTKGNLFLRSLLEGLPLARLDFLEPAAFDAKLKDGSASEYDVVVLDGALPTQALGATGLPAGSYLVFGAVPAGAGSGLTDKGPGAQAAIVDWQREHPTLQGVGLDSMVIAEARVVEVAPGGASQTLAMSDQGPAIVELAQGDAHAIVVPFDPGNSNWPFNVSFVVFTASAVNYLGGSGADSPTRRSISPGQTLSDRLPAGSEGIRLDLPDGATRDLSLQPDGTISYAPIERTGVYRVSWKGRGAGSDSVVGDRVARFYAANLLDQNESDCRSVATLPLATRVVEASKSSSGKSDDYLWPWFVGLALLVMLAEWYVYNRKVQI